ncbi:MAG TPA: TldD/PmbA family protein [Nitrospiria bacterium]
MIDEKQFKKITEIIRGQAGSAGVEVILTDRREGLTRFGNNIVSQHVESRNAELEIRILDGKKQGKAGCNRFDRETLGRTVERAAALARVQKEDPSLLPFPGPQSYREISHHYSPTAKVLPGHKVDRLKAAIKPVIRTKARAAGTFTHGEQAVGISNSAGLYVFNRYTSAQFGVTVMAGDGSGWAEATHPDIRTIDPVALTAAALEKALASRHPKEFPPGAYDVILEPAAVAELLLFMAWEGFGALQFQEGRSFLSGKIGKKVFDDRVTIVDDVFDPLTMGLAFDYEGMPRKPVSLIENGIARALVFDRKTARAGKTETTGHSLPQPNTVGPLPLNLSLAGGDSSLDEMVAGTDKGLLITHFHYTNILDPVSLTITGMTRDGVFRVEKGKVRGPVKNFRFTESVVGAFNRIEAIGAERTYAHSFWGGGIIAPAMKIRNFNFSSGTEF